MPSKPHHKGRRNKHLIRIILDCNKPVKDELFDTSILLKYLKDKIKVDGKTGQLSDRVSLRRDRTRVVVTAKLPFSKRYCKYLLKKFLKKYELKDFLRVVANRKNSYELRYYSINDGAEAEV